MSEAAIGRSLKVAIIDDVPNIMEVVSLCLELRWPDVRVISAAKGAKGLALVEAERPDLVLVDIGLPDMSGFDVIRDIRRFSDVPIIVLSVRGEDTDIVRGLELGADDYITKPFSHIELLARVQSLLRRARALPSTAEEQCFSRGPLIVDFTSHEVRVKGEPVKLTPIEFNLLHHLVRNEGRTLSHRTLLQKVWGPDYLDDTPYVKVYIQRLRNKLETKGGAPKMIFSERGRGYRFVAPE